MARIELSDGYLVRSDAHNWIAAQMLVYQTGEHEGETYEQVLGFYPSLGAALTGLLGYKLRESDATSLRDVKKLLDDFRREVGEMYLWE